MASATRAGSGQSPACARKTISLATGNSLSRSSSLDRISETVTRAKMHLKSAIDGIYLPKIVGVKLDDEIADHARDEQIDHHGIPSDGNANFAGALFLVILV